MTDIKTNGQVKKEITARDFGHYSPMIGGDLFRHYLLLSVNDIGKRVGATMGAMGRTSGSLVFNEQTGEAVLITTKDGSNTLASLKNSCVRSNIVLDLLGNEIPAHIYAAAVTAIHSVATQTEKRAGDGTTATTVIACAFIKSVLSKINHKELPAFCRTLDSEAKNISDSVYNAAVKDEFITEDMLVAIATTSLNHDKELGEKVGKAIFRAGKRGYCFVDGSKGAYQDKIETVSGYTFASTNNPLFFNRGGRGIYEEPLIIVSKDPIDYITYPKGEKPTVAELFKHHEMTCGKLGGIRPLVVFCPSMAGSAAQAFEHNFKMLNIPVLFVEFRDFHGDQQAQILEDIAIATGAKLFSTENNCNISKIFTVENPYGAASKIFLEKGYFYLASPQNDNNFTSYIENLSSKIDYLDADKDLSEKHWLQRRYAALVSGIIRIIVAASSDAELIERKDSVTDAQLACFSALRKGIVTGGGVALYNLTPNVESVFKDAMLAPISQILSNANIQFNYTDLVGYGLNAGYDVLTSEIRDFWQGDKILDPAESVAEAFTNAASIAKTLLMLENFNY